MGDGAGSVDELEREVARLGAAEAFLRSVLDSAPDFIVRIDPNGTVLYINRVAPGFRPEDLIGHSVFEFIDPGYHQRAREVYARVVGTGEPEAYEAMGYGAHGEPAHFLVNVGAIRDGDAVTALTLVLTDVTSLKRVERELRESEAKLRLAVGASGMGLWSWDVAADRLTWDETCRRIAGVPLDEPPRSVAELLELVHPDDLPGVRARLAELERGRTPGPNELRFVRPDGSVRWVWTLGTAICDDAGRLVSVVGGLLDVTQRRATEEQLRQVQKLEAVGRLTSGIAHNFNNMLGVILPSLELASSKDGAEARALIAGARDAAERAAELVRQLMRFAGHRPRAVAAPTRVADLVERTVAIARGAFDRRIEMTVTAAPGLPLAQVDPLQLEQAILNILINARDALEGVARSPRIDVAIDAVDPGAVPLQAHPSARPVEHVRVRVQDNGCGMDETTRLRVFEPFFTTKEVGKGTGVGLSTAFGAIRDAGGFLQCTSSPGRGTTFTILLPASQCVGATPPVDAS